MKKNRLVRLFVLLTLLVSSVTAFGWSFDEMRYELEYGIKMKDYYQGDSSNQMDGLSGATKNFREEYVNIGVKPLEDSELTVTFGYSHRDYTSITGQSKGIDREKKNITREITLGNTWMLGKLLLRPEFGIRKTHFGGIGYNTRLNSLTEYRLYPKMTYSFTNKLNAYTRGYFGWTDMERSGTYTDRYDGNSTKYRLEAGTRYKFNNKYALSVAYARDNNDDTQLNYKVYQEQVRLRFHWTPTRRITVVPHIFISTGGKRSKHNYDTTTGKYKSMTYQKDRVGINANFKATNSITVLAQIHHEWNQDGDGGYGFEANNPSRNRTARKNNMFYNLGLKHTF